MSKTCFQHDARSLSRIFIVRNELRSREFRAKPQTVKIPDIFCALTRSKNSGKAELRLDFRVRLRFLAGLLVPLVDSNYAAGLHECVSRFACAADLGPRGEQR